MSEVIGIGAAPRRKEDLRFLTGRGNYVADIQRPAMVAGVFVRSPHAHAEIKSIDTGAARAMPGVLALFTGADLKTDGVNGLPCGWGIKGKDGQPMKEPPHPAMAQDKVRYVGDAVACVVAENVQQARNAAEAVAVDYHVLPAVIGLTDALKPEAALVYDDVPNNLCCDWGLGDKAATDAAFSKAAHVARIKLVNNRLVGNPMEPRAAVAEFHPETGQYTLWSTSQFPHVVRLLMGLFVLNIPQQKLRVIAPDVGGGFGVKTMLYPEDVALCVLAMRLGRPVKWVEQRREGLQASAHARDHHYHIKAGFDAEGRLLALDVRALCNAGAYSVTPWTAGIEALMAGGLLTGPYRLANYRCEVTAVATHTTPAGPYRGVARPATTFVMERLLDLGARALGLDPVQIRRVNLIGAGDLPYTSATRLVHDSPTYPVCFEKAVSAIGYEAFRAEQMRLRGEGRYVGVGFAVYNELTGLGQAASAGPRMPFRTGHEGVTVRMDPSGAVTVLAGVTSQGQGLETTMAQLVAGELGVPIDTVRVVLGDTDATPFGLGAFASRQAVIGGGAAIRAARAVRDKALHIAAHALEAAVEDLEMADGWAAVRGVPGRALAMTEIARIAHLETHRLPPDLEPGLDATRFYDPIRGTFTAGAQSAIVEVEPETGRIAIRRWVCVEDTGRIINPLIVEGQVHGAIAQGIGGALAEHLVYDETGQLLTGTFMEYAVPTAAVIPSFETEHVEERAANLAGVRGVGEGGTLGPAAVLANAVADALAPLGVEPDELPLSPGRLWRACSAAARR